MATTVHIPEEILRRVDVRAKALNLSRNRFIVETLEKALDDHSAWSPEFLEFLRSAPPLDLGDEFLESILANRRSKAPLVL